jgi:CDP-diacylglycerol pyrophosphatase
MNDKVQHVVSQKQTRFHTCHWPNCDKQVPPAMWGCRKHWYMLPGTLRAKIWATYRIGQERDLQPSAEYLAVAAEVQEWIKLWDIL